MPKTEIQIPNRLSPFKTGSVVEFHDIEKGQIYRAQQHDDSFFLFRNDGKAQARVVVKGVTHHINGRDIARDLVLDVGPGELVTAGPFETVNWTINNNGLYFKSDKPLSLALQRQTAEGGDSVPRRVSRAGQRSRGQLVKMTDAKNRAWAAA